MITHFKSPEHRFLSNFFVVDIEFRGVVYPSSEHAYMSAKSDEEVEIDGIKYPWKYYCALPKVTPSKIKGESRFVTLPDNWDEIRVQVMYEILVNKFSKDPLRSRLVETGQQNIQEGNWHGDKFWGVDLRENPNVGENNLGRLLMKIRDEIGRGDY